MTVKELIEKLKGFDEKLEVVITEYGGVLDIGYAVFQTEVWKSKDGKETEYLDILL